MRARVKEAGWTRGYGAISVVLGTAAALAAAFSLMAESLTPSLLPSRLVLSGSWQPAGGAPSALGAELDPTWSVVLDRQQDTLRGRVMVPGHPLLQSAEVVASIYGSQLQGLLRGDEGSVLGGFDGQWGIRSAAGDYWLVTGELGRWVWTASSARIAVLEGQQ